MNAAHRLRGWLRAGVAISVVFCRSAFAQGIITTYAGAAHVFTDNGQPATAAQLIGPSAIALDNQGNVFIVATDLNTVFEVGPDGILNAVAGAGQSGFSGDSGPAVLALLNAPTGLAFDSTGNMYIADAGNQRVRMVTSDGTISTVAGTGQIGFAGDNGPATKATLSGPWSVAVDSSGNLSILDRFNLRVRRVDSTGTISTVVGTGASCAAPCTATAAGDGGPAINATLNQPLAICFDAQDNLYIADQFSQRVRRVTPDGTITSVAGSGNNGFSGDNGQALNAALSSPAGVAVDANGDVYFSDSQNQRIRRVDPSGIITTVAGNGRSDFSGDGGPASSAALSRPLGLAVDTSGQVYVADYENNRVRVFTPEAAISTFAGAGLSVGDSGPAVSARLNAPTAVAIDSGGNLLIADSGNSRIRIVAADGTIATFAGNGHTGSAGDGGPAVSAYLFDAQGIAVGPFGDVYIADSTNNVIRRVAPSGVISVFAGTHVCCYDGDGGPANKALLFSPTSVVVDAAGNVYFNNLVRTPAGLIQGVRVRRVTPDGIINTVAGNGAVGFSGDNGPALEASLGGAVSLGLDASDNLLIADTGNNRVRMVDASGTITTIAGNGEVGSTGDGGPATDAAVQGPWGLAVDASGNLFISSAQSVIRKVAPDGTISTYTGGQYGFAGDGGPATGASLAFPKGLAVDAAGNLYIADQSNDRVRVVSPQ